MTSDLPAAPAPPADDERTQAARRRGLSAPYIAGGRDPDPDSARREERRLVRILVAFVVVVVLAGYVLGFLAQALGLPFTR